MRVLKPWLDLATNWDFLSIWYQEYLVQKTSISEEVWQGLIRHSTSTNWHRFFLKHSCNPRWVTRTNAPRCHHWALLSSHTLVALLQRCLHWPSGVQDDSSHITEYHATRLLKFTQPRVYNTSIVYSNWSPNYRRKYPLYFEYINIQNMYYYTYWFCYWQIKIV